MSITLIIIIFTVLTSIKAMDDSLMKSKLMFNAYRIKYNKEWYRFFSSGIIHADWFHLAFNMFSLYMFGEAVENAYKQLFGAGGILLYLLLYVGGLAMSSIYSFEKHKNDIHYNALGASGAVSSVIFAFILFAPTTSLMFIMLPIPIPAYLFGIIYLGVEYYLSKRGNTNIGHDAHFWGAIFGLLFTIILKPALVSFFITQITQ